MWSAWLRRSFVSLIAPYRVFDDSIPIPASCGRWKFAVLPKTKRSTFATFLFPDDNVRRAFGSPTAWFDELLRGKDCLAIVGVHDPPTTPSDDDENDLFTNNTLDIDSLDPIQPLRNDQEEQVDDIEDANIDHNDVTIDEARSTATAATVETPGSTNQPTAIANRRWEVYAYEFDLTRHDYDQQSLHDPPPQKSLVGSIYLTDEHVIECSSIRFRLLRARADSQRFYAIEPSLAGVLIPSSHIDDDAFTTQGILQSLVSHLWDHFAFDIEASLTDNELWESTMHSQSLKVYLALMRPVRFSCFSFLTF